MALLDAQYGDTPQGSRIYGEGLPREIMKLSENFAGDTYRAAYSVAFPECVYLLDVFMKKSKSGVATPREVLNRISTRWRAAQGHHASKYPKQEKQ